MSSTTPRASSGTSERIDSLIDHPLRTALIVLALAAIPGLAVITAVWAFFGRERRTGYDREYEQEPPTDTQPALVPVLLGQGGQPGSYEWTATLFDLIRRGVYRAEPVTTERKIWGGLRTQTVSDLELSPGEDQSVRSWEQRCRARRRPDPRRRPRAAVALPGPHRERADVDGAALHVVQGARRRRDEDAWLVQVDRRPPTRARVCPVPRDWASCWSSSPPTAGAPSIRATRTSYSSSPAWRSSRTRFSSSSRRSSSAASGARRSPEGQAEAERWDAFSSYLSDFPRLDEAPPATPRALGALSRVRDRVRDR